jgi:cold-inducible RNA-binding protein
MKNIFVGNLPYNATEEALRDLFGPFGGVQQVRIMTDRDTGRSRGFAFVEMAEDDDAEKAIAALNGKDFGGRPLTINEARPRREHSGGDGGKRRGGRTSFRGSRSSREPRW